MDGDLQRVHSAVIGRRASILVLALLPAAPAIGEEIRCSVVRVADGDTITVVTIENQQHRVRVAGIDAPEKGQPYADRSRESLARMAMGKAATLDCHKTDRYQRKVCKVWVRPADCSSCGHTLDAGLAQISAGLAWWYRAYAHEQLPEDRGRYESEEAEARLRKRGLWSMPYPVPSWEWRSERGK